MSGPIWISNQLYLGRVMIGSIQRPSGAHHWIGLSFLPGAANYLREEFPNEKAAMEAVEKSANSRCRAMLGVDLQATSDAVHQNRRLRAIARAIWRAGVWTCDRPVDAYALFSDLGKALSLKPEDAPRPLKEGGSGSGSSAEPTPEPVDLIETA